MIIKLFFAGLILFLNATAATSQDQHPISKAYHSPSDQLVVRKLSTWQDLKFGFFMHWGPYSQWGVMESWTICPEDWTKRTGPYADNYFNYKKAYENLQTTFNPSDFNPEEWAKAARYAGMKYLVFTTKHHDGFCMFDTKETDYKITSNKTPYSANQQSDITKEIFKVFRKNNFMIGAYFSKSDWNSEYYWWPYFPPRDRNPNYDIAKHPERWENFAKFTYTQIEELMTRYGLIDILWLDGGQVRPPTQDIRMDKIAVMARKNQPGLIIVDRTVSGEFENYVTPEQEIPEKALNIPWEACMTMGDSWSYKPNDNYKSTHLLIEYLIEIVSKGGNFLLNVGPQPDGKLPAEALHRMKEIGDWMKVNGEAIYGSHPVEPYGEQQLRFTQKSDTVYAIYLTKMEGDGLPEKVKFSSLKPKTGSKVYLVGYETPLKWHIVANDEVVLNIPKSLIITPPCRHAFSFRFTVAG